MLYQEVQGRVHSQPKVRFIVNFEYFSIGEKSEKIYDMEDAKIINFPEQLFLKIFKKFYAHII